MKKIKAGIIGFGGMANYHLHKMGASKLFDVVGIYDISEEAKDRGRKKGLVIYDSYEALAASREIEVVLIATPNDVHAEYAIKLARDGKNIICEKPVTLSSEALGQMIRAAEENNVMLMVHQNRRWDKDFLKIKALHDSNALGSMYKVESNVTGSHGVPGAWRKIKAKGGGMLWDWGVHLIDQLLFMHNEKVVGVTCRASYVYGLDCDDGIEMTLDFADGFEGRVYIDTNKFVETPRWYAYGLDGSAVIENWNCKGRVVRVKTFDDKKNKGIQAGNGFTKTMADRSKSTVKRSRLPKIEPDSFAFYKNVYACIREGAPQVIKNESVMRCMKVMEAGFQSIEEKKTIQTNI